MTRTELFADMREFWQKLSTGSPEDIRLESMSEREIVDMFTRCRGGCGEQVVEDVDFDRILAASSSPIDFLRQIYPALDAGSNSCFCNWHVIDIGAAEAK